MDPTSLISLLGRPSSDEGIELALKHFQIRRRPRVDIDDEDPDGPVIEPRDWLINSRAGIEFGFEDEASFRNFDDIEGGQGPMILTQIYLYGRHPGVRQYQGELPFSLNIDDNREVVRRKLQTVDHTRRSYVRDVWELPECRITISYAENDAIGFLLLWSRRDPVRFGDLPLAAPDLHGITRCFGKNIGDPLLREVFDGFSLSATDPREQFRRVDFREDYGFELRFFEELGLGHVALYREHEMGSRGWSGQLPGHLDFNDSPERMFKKMGQPPDTKTDEQFSGSATWFLPEYCLRVNYSTMRNYLTSVELLSSFAIDAYDIEH